MGLDPSQATPSPLVAQALRVAAEGVTCAARGEPLLYDVRRVLLQEKPALLQSALLADRLQLTVALCGKFYEAQQRLLGWVSRVDKPAGGGLVRLTLTATLADSLKVLAHSELELPRIWEQQGAPNTVLELSSEAFVQTTRHAAEPSSWVVQQAEYQACGVLSNHLAQLVETIRRHALVDILAWPVYDRVETHLDLRISQPHVRAGLWLRAQVAQRQSDLENCEAQADAAARRIGLEGHSHWSSLTKDATEPSLPLRDKVRAAGLASTTVAQLKTVQAAVERLQLAAAEVSKCEAAAIELRSLARVPRI